MNANNKTVVQKLKKGNKVVFEIIFNAYFPRIQHFAMRYIADEATAENIAQDVFVDLWVQKSTLSDESNLNAWLYSVAKNKSIKQLERMKVESRYKKHATLHEKRIISNQIALNNFDTTKITCREIETIIKKTIDKLPNRCRKIFLMNRYQDKKYVEIAREMNISLKTVESHMSKALKIFRANLGQYINT